MYGGHILALTPASSPARWRGGCSRPERNGVTWWTVGSLLQTDWSDHVADVLAVHALGYHISPDLYLQY